MAKKTDSPASTVFFLLFFFGLAVTVFAIVDLHWMHRVLIRPSSPIPQESR